MFTLHIHVAGSPPQAVILEGGRYPVGRGPDNSVRIEIPSVSDSHAEFVVDESGALWLRDLGSTNGTSVNGQPVVEAALKPGDSVKLGDAIIRIQGSASPVPTPVTAAATTGAGRGYLADLAGAFVYPFRGDSLPIVAGMSIAATLCDLLPGALGVASIILGFATYVVMLSVFRLIIQATIQGEERVPDPSMNYDLGEIRDVLVPYYALSLFAFLPMTLSRFVPDAPKSLPLVLGVLAVLFLPMALLLLTVTENFWAANPWNAIRSFARAPVGYLPAVALFAGMLGLVSLELLPTDYYAGHRLITLGVGIVAGLVQIYLIFVLGRVLGLYYRHHEQRLRWLD